MLSKHNKITVGPLCPRQDGIHQGPSFCPHFVPSHFSSLFSFNTDHLAAGWGRLSSLIWLETNLKTTKKQPQWLRGHVQSREQAETTCVYTGLSKLAHFLAQPAQREVLVGLVPPISEENVPWKKFTVCVSLKAQKEQGNAVQTTAIRGFTVFH